MRYLKVWFTDEGFESIPVAEDFEMPELDEIDVMPNMWLCVDTADGSEVGFPLRVVYRYQLTENE